MAKAREIPGFAADISFREAAARAVGTRADEVWEHEQRAMDTRDIEGVHDMRVATRRLRAAMEIFAPSFPTKRHKRALGEVKELADLLGARRDPDVMIERLRGIEAKLTKEDRPGIDSLCAELRADQEEANRRLADELARLRQEKLPERLRLLAAEVRE
ncbi:MAG: CHAD domain-containing protein [Thermoleophilaceae bacterium]